MSIQSSAAKKFAIFALPAMTALTPAFAQAECHNDSMGFNSALTNIEIDANTLTNQQKHALRGPNAYNEIMPGLLRAATTTASDSVIETVMQSREQLLDSLNGEKPEDLGLPAYPAYADARDAYLCAMGELRSNRVMYADQKAQYSKLEDGFHRLLIVTATSEEDIQQRLDTIRQAEAQGNLKGYDHDYTQVDKFTDRIRANTIVDIVTSDPDRLNAFITFAVNEIQNPDSDIRTDSLGQVLQVLSMHDHEYVPDFLDYIDQDKDAFNYLLAEFIDDIDTDEFNDEIRSILRDKSEHGDDATIRFLAEHMLSRFDADTNSFAPRGPDYFK